MTRTRLIDASERLFVRKGFDDASAEEISETAGYSRGAFYSNFDNKEQVFLAVIDRRRPKALDDILQQASESSRADRRSPRVVLKSMEAQGFHRPPNGIQPTGNASSFCAEAPCRTASAGTRNVLRFRGSEPWRDRRSSGSPSGDRRACTVGRCTRLGSLAIDTETECEHMYREAAKLVFDRMTASEISHLG